MYIKVPSKLRKRKKKPDTLSFTIWRIISPLDTERKKITKWTLTTSMAVSKNHRSNLARDESFPKKNPFHIGATLLKIENVSLFTLRNVTFHFMGGKTTMHTVCVSKHCRPHTHAVGTHTSMTHTHGVLLFSGWLVHYLLLRLTKSILKELCNHSSSQSSS